MTNKTLATIAGQNITQEDLQKIIMRYPQEKRGYFETEEAKKQLLEQAIAFELINKFGQELKLNETDEYNENLKQAQKDILTQVTMNKVLSDVTVTDADALEYYNNNKEVFTQAPTVTAKHILVDSKETCDKIKAEIEAGEISFEDAAKKYSSCPSKEQGGNLGSFGKGMMVPEFEQAAFTLEIGVVSESVQTQFGYHLIKVENRSESVAAEFEEVKPRIVNELMQQMQQRKYLDVVKELETKYGVTRL